MRRPVRCGPDCVYWEGDVNARHRRDPVPAEGPALLDEFFADASVIPAGAIPGEPREVTITGADLTGLMDQLDDLLPSGHGTPGQQPT